MPFHERKDKKSISDQRTDRIPAQGEIAQSDPNLQRIKEDPYAKKRRRDLAGGRSWLGLMRRPGREEAQVPTTEMQVQQNPQGEQSNIQPNRENEMVPLTRRTTEKLHKPEKDKSVVQGRKKKGEPIKDSLDKDLIKILESRKDNKGCRLFRRRRRKNLEKKIGRLMSKGLQK